MYIIIRQSRLIKELTQVVSQAAPVAHQVNLPSHQFFLHAAVHIYEVQPVCHDGIMHTISITLLIMIINC
jgi:hypothetical protein